MIENIIRWSLRNRAIVLLLSVVLVGTGLSAMLALPIDAVPDVTNVQVQVLTSAPALGPEEVERFVTTPVELSMSGLPGLVEVRSVSRFGLSAVTVVFVDGTDIQRARQLVNERLQGAREEIPEGYGDPELGPVSTGLGEIFQFEVRGEGKTPMELRTLLEWEVAPRLRRVKGVIEINSFGGELKTYEVQLDPERLTKYDVAVNEVFEALQRNNANAGGAYIEKNSEQYLVRGEGLITSLEDVGDIVVTTSDDGTPIYVKQLGSVAFAPMVRQGAVTRDGRGEVVTGIVMMLMGASSREVVIDVKAALKEMRPALKKLGVTIEPFYDRAELVKKTVNTVAFSLIEGGLLVIVVLFLMLRNLRAGLIVASAIPLSLLVAFLGMREWGVSGNLMSLGAIDFGLIVDGAVIILENSVRRLAERSHALGRAVTPEERIEVVLVASKEVLKPAMFGGLIIMIVYLPILTLTGIEGKMFRPMALTVLFALAGAMVLSLTLMPVLASLFLGRRISEKESFIVAAVRKVYEPILRLALRLRVATVGIALLFLAATAALVPFMGAEFVPRLDEGAIALQAWRLPSVSLEESVRQTTLLEKVLKQFPEVTTVVSKTGRAEIATDPMGVEISDVFVMLKPHSQWKTAGTREGLIARFDEALKRNLPGSIFSYSQPIELRVSELISGVRSDVAFKIFGDDLDVLKQTADRAVAVLSRIDGAADVKAEQTAGLPVLRVKIDRHAIARYGINAGDVLDVVSTIGGRNAGVVLEGQRRFDLQVRFAPETRKRVELLSSLKVRAPGGQMIPLGQLATLVVEDGPAQISHESGRRRITVEANVRGRDLAGFVGDAEKAIEKADVVPAGYFGEWGGQFENLKAASRRLMIVVPAALFLIFMLLYLSHGSVGLAALIFLNVPFAITGGIFALVIRGLPLSISAGVGFIALFGVAVLNGLVLIEYIKHRRDDGATAEVAAYDGARARLRAVLTTALVASLGFIPMAIARGAGAEVQKPLATVVIGGLITSTLLTLFVLPTVYAWLFGIKERAAARAQRRQALSEAGGEAP
ncbi:MAG: efflux RND transporter permease subunit [Deltaproteobacteria bacterium]|nr:efflux RND transporter permease subunit [Deltaproteobacteria bacterium]